MASKSGEKLSVIGIAHSISTNIVKHIRWQMSGDKITTTEKGNFDRDLKEHSEPPAENAEHTSPTINTKKKSYVMMMLYEEGLVIIFILLESHG